MVRVVSKKNMFIFVADRELIQSYGSCSIPADSIPFQIQWNYLKNTKILNRSFYFEGFQGISAKNQKNPPVVGIPLSGSFIFSRNSGEDDSKFLATNSTPQTMSFSFGPFFSKWCKLKRQISNFFNILSVSWRNFCHFFTCSSVIRRNSLHISCVFSSHFLDYLFVILP